MPGEESHASQSTFAAASGERLGVRGSELGAVHDAVLGAFEVTLEKFAERFGTVRGVCLVVAATARHVFEVHEERETLGVVGGGRGGGGVGEAGGARSIGASGVAR